MQTFKETVLWGLSAGALVLAAMLPSQAIAATLADSPGVNANATTVADTPRDGQASPWLDSTAPGSAFAQTMFALRQRFAGGLRLASAKIGEVTLQGPEPVARFYRERQFQPAWINASGRPKTVARELIAAIHNAGNEGLRPDFYHAKPIAEITLRLEMSRHPESERLANFELLLTDAFLAYGRHLSSGRLDPRAVDRNVLLEPPQYDLTAALQQALYRGEVRTALGELSPAHPGYSRLRKALLRYRGIVARGGWSTVSSGPKLMPDMIDSRVPVLRARLRASGDYTPLAAATEALRYDGVLAAAVRRFQARHGLQSDGIVAGATLKSLNLPASERVRQLELNLERLRWLPRDLGERYILVNITDYAMSVVENGAEVLSSRVVVGQSRRPTPVMSERMSYLVLSPYWYVPRTIAVEDKLPLLQKNPYALSKKGIRIFAGRNEIDPGEVDWHAIDASNFDYELRQDPGPANALGGVKFMFPNKHSVYLHDTSTPQLFDRSQRALSSGCVRIDSPYELAEYLLRDDPEWSRDSLEGLAKRGRQRRVELPREMPVHLLYWTAWVEGDDTVHFRRDIYRRDKRLGRAMFASLAL